ncbi:hypothetical protein CI102_4706 [Trichoderma harzianum]|nr:hypothetical protein CI102_4706 [Trichoderma harzianum]
MAKEGAFTKAVVDDASIAHLPHSDENGTASHVFMNDVCKANSNVVAFRLDADGWHLNVDGIVNRVNSETN